MKRSEYIKELSVTGKNGTITGEIRVVMNYGSKTIDWNNHSTHDTEKKTIAVHKIEAYIGTTLWWKDVEIKSDNLVLSEVERCKKQMTQEMNRMANDKPTPTFAEKFEAI